MFSEEQQTIEAVKRVAPAVVSIVVSKAMPKTKTHAGTLDAWLKPTVPAGKKLSPHALKLDDLETEPTKIGGGSGFIVDASGIILTNKHVVLDSQAEYQVVTADEKEYPAQVVTRDPINDIAILKILATDLPIVTLSTAPIEPGQTVLAIGNALGLFSNTVSKGIVSGLSRQISAAMRGESSGQESVVEELRGVIQTDVAINQGNSGGPLINLSGEVIGINTAVIFGAQNISFALPIHWAKDDLHDLHEYGHIVRPYIGLRYLAINPEIKKKYKLSVDQGALVTKEHVPHSQAVIKDSPADQAGLSDGDIVLSIADEVIDVHTDLSDIIQKHHVGDKLEVTYLRSGKEKKTEIALEERK